MNHKTWHSFQIDKGLSDHSIWHYYSLRTKYCENNIMCGSLVFVDFIGQLNHKCKGQNETVVNFKVCPYVYIFLSANLIDHKMSFIGKQQKGDFTLWHPFLQLL